MLLWSRFLQRSETLKNSDTVSVLQRMAIKTGVMCPLSFYSETLTLAIGFNVSTTPRYVLIVASSLQALTFVSKDVNLLL